MSAMEKSHLHSEPKGVALATAARTSLEAAGEKWTAMRGSVFEALAEFSKPASAYDVTDLLAKRAGRRIAPNSVYRILDLFVEANLVLRVESANAYVVNAHPGCLHDCMFLVCDRCGAAAHVDDDVVSRSVRDAATRSGFVAHRPVVEVRGTCAICTAA